MLSGFCLVLSLRTNLYDPHVPVVFWGTIMPPSTISDQLEVVLIQKLFNTMNIFTGWI